MGRIWWRGLYLSQRRYNDICIGFSCHTPNIYTSLAAATIGVEFIEKHVTLDQKAECPDKDVSLSFSQIKELCEEMYHNGEISRTANYRYFIQYWFRHYGLSMLC